MKVYMLTEADFERLRLRLNQEPHKGLVRVEVEQRESFIAASRSLTYTVETWIAEVQK